MIKYKVESLKDFLLIFLILLSILFTSFLWYGYSASNFLTFLQYNNINKSSAISKVDVIPEKIIISYGNEYFLVIPPANAGLYKNISNISKSIVKKLLGGHQNGNSYTFNNEKWANYSAQKSINIKYACNIDYTLYKSLYSFTGESAISGIKDIIIVPDFIRDVITVYVHDEKQNKIFSYHQSMNLMPLKKYMHYDAKSLKVSYSRYTIISSHYFRDELYWPVDCKKISIHPAKITNEFDITRSSDIEKLKSVYFKNPSVATVDTDKWRDKTVYGNEGVLWLKKNGYLEYSYTAASVGEDKGLPDAYNDAVDFVEKTGGFPGMMYISEVKTKSKGDYLIGFNYYSSGIMVTTNSYKNNEIKHAIEVEVSNGKVIDYKRFVKTIIPSEKVYHVSVSTDTVLGRATTIVKNIDGDPKQYSNLDLCYDLTSKNTNTLQFPKWQVCINGKNFTVPAY